MRYLIVGTGPSVKHFSPSLIKTVLSNENIIVVSVNTSIMFLKRADIWFSLDPSKRNLECYKYCLSKNIYSVLALPGHYNKNRIPKLTSSSYAFCLKRKSNSTYKSVKNPSTVDEWFEKWGCLEGLADAPNEIHSGNSLYGALNLVYHDKPDKIGILGLDGNSLPSKGGGHVPKNLSHLPKLFSSAVEQLETHDIKVKVGNKTSSVDCFDRVSCSELIKWLEN